MVLQNCSQTTVQATAVMEIVDTHETLMEDIVYCPTRTIDWRHLLQDVFRGPDLPDWPQLSGACIIPFYQGRVALWFLCQHWQIKPGDEVVMPAYNCGSEVDPFGAYGAKVILYRVDENAQMDYEDIKKQCTHKTRIVYITHYFGWPQQVSAIYQWCKERSINVVEDCALALFSRGSEGYLGTLADASIFSFRKTLSVPDGAALVLKESIDADTLSLRPPSVRQTFRNLLPFAKSAALAMLDASRLYRPLRRWKLKSFDFNKLADKSVDEVKPDMPTDYYFDRKLINQSISNVSCGILKRENPDIVIKRRRQNYLALYKELKDLHGMKVLFNTLPEGVCPLGFVMKVSCRKKVTQALNAHGIAAFSWWEGYHQDFCWDDFPEARCLKNTVLFLPINQSLNQVQLRYIGNVTRNCIVKLSI